MKGTVLITGGAKRIGKELCLYLPNQGYSIALHYNTSHSEAQEVAAEITQAGVTCRLFSGDLSTLADAQKTIQQVFDSCSDIHTIINNASIYEKGSLTDMTLNALHTNMNLHFYTPVLFAQELKKRQKTGHIINIIDAKIKANQPGMFAYLISKKSLHAATELLAVELAPDIRVNAIAPGTVLPPPGKDDSYLEPLIKTIPLAKQAAVSDILLAVDFLMKNRYYTGQTLFVDGGQYL